MITNLVLPFILITQAQFGDSIAIFNFEANKMPVEQAIAITNMLRNEIGKLTPVFPENRLINTGIYDKDSIQELYQSFNIHRIIVGKIRKIAGKYQITTVYQDLSRGITDTITTVNSDPLVTTQFLAKYIVRIKNGEEELDFGSIKIESQPKAAEVLLDGEYVGITPIKLDLIQFGEHSILLSKRGYNTAIKLIVVSPSKTSVISEKLEPITGTLIASTEDMPVYLLDEVVVRGEKIKEKLFDLPKGVDVISRREIEYSGAKDVPTLLSQVTGVSVVDPTGSGTISSISIRGMDPSKYTTVTIDGVTVNTLDGRVNWSTIPIELIKRIEIIKSSPSLYGGQAAGGVINIITKQKEKNKISLSTTNAKDIGGALTLSVSDVWSMWANTSGRKGEGWRYNDKYDIRNVYVKSNFPLDKYNAIGLSLELQNDNITLPGGLSETELDTNPDTSGIDIETKYQQSVRLSSKYEVEAKNYKFLLNFNTMPQVYESKLQGSKQRMDGVNVAGNSSYERENFTLNTNIEWEFNRRRITDNALTMDDNAQLLSSRILMEWKEQFYSITLLPGINGEWLGYWFQETTIEPHYASTLAPKLGVLWGSDLFDLFASFEKALRLPKPYEKVKNLKLSPELLSVIETGLRFKKKMFTFSFSAFYIRIEDQILAEGNTFVNHGNAIHKGLENELDLRINDKISLFSNYTTIDAKSTVSEDTSYWVPGTPIQNAIAGIRISKIPTYSFTIAYNWKGISFIDYSNELGTVPSYGILDASSKFSLRPNLFLSISITNILDTGGKSFGYKLNNEAKYYPISPRGVRVETEFEF